MCPEPLAIYDSSAYIWTLFRFNRSAEIELDIWTWVDIENRINDLGRIPFRTRAPFDIASTGVYR